MQIMLVCVQAVDDRLSAFPNNDAASITLWYNNNSQSIRQNKNMTKPFIIIGKLHFLCYLLFKRNGSLVLNGDRQVLVIATSSAIYLSLDHAVFLSGAEVSKFLHSSAIVQRADGRLTSGKTLRTFSPVKSKSICSKDSFAVSG